MQKGRVVSTFKQTLERRRSGRDFSPEPVPRALLARLIWAGQGISGDSGKRTAPSAHALHPLSLYISAGHISDLAPGVYRATAGEDDLALHMAADVRGDLERAALEEQPWIGAAAGIITIAADLVAATTAFADQPPYGARGNRYVHIEAGAVAQNIALQAAEEGLACVLVAGFKDEATADVLALQPPIAPILHMCFGWPAEGP